MRAVVIAVIISFFPGAAMAADHYVEVWNPPEASGNRAAAVSKKASHGARPSVAGNATKSAKGSSKSATKPATSATTTTASKRAGKAATNTGSGKTKLAAVAAGSTPKHPASAGGAKSQNAATFTSSHNGTTTKSARTASVKPKSAALGRALPPILG